MKLKIGTRKSKLALIQTEIICRLLKEKYDVECEVIKVTTKGDKILDKSLSSFGGKGVFVGEIEEMLRSGEIDIAVHSGKDLPIKLADGLTIGGTPSRANPEDILVYPVKKAPRGTFSVGTGSLRRQLQFKKLHSECNFKDIRGNVDTRLSKLLNGEYDALILARAGVERLNPPLINECEVKILPVEKSVPAAAQGIIAAECRKDSEAERFLQGITDKNTYICFMTERHILELMDSGCNAPLGVYSEINGDKITITAWYNNDKNIIKSDEVQNYLQLAEDVVKEMKNGN